ncbi:hypothetical protein EP7_004519 [Isosphaeraceae bacterium EP7]
MDTTISDFSKFAAALMPGVGLSTSSRAELARPQLHITTPSQFPTLPPDLPAEKQRRDLHAGLGVIAFDGPQGPGFYKGGHDNQSANTMVCIEKGRRCVLILFNDVRSEAAFAGLVKFIIGETGVPYEWDKATPREGRERGFPPERCWGCFPGRDEWKPSERR